MAGALSYETVLRNLVSLCSSRPANASDAFDAGELFIKQLEALERAFRLSGTHQNTSFNGTMLPVIYVRVKTLGLQAVQSNRGETGD